MQKLLNVLVVVIGLMCLGLWAQWMFAFDAMSKQWDLVPGGLVGMNNLRGDIGGLFLSATVFCALYFRFGAVWLRAAAVAMGCVALGRVVSLVADGFAPPALGSLLIELAFITVFLAAARGADVASANTAA